MVIQYVDDSSSMISTNNLDELKGYINRYFKILEEYYNINKLSLNSDKTKLRLNTEQPLNC